MSESTNLLRLLKRVYLGGIIEEAVVDLDNYTSQAVDLTNSLFLRVSTKSDNNKIGSVGIGNLSLVCKYLETFKGEIKVKKAGNRVVISSNKHGELKYLTTDPEFIPTAVAEDNIERLIKPCVIKIDLDKQVCMDFSSYFSLVKSKSATFLFNSKSKSVSIESGLESDHQFSLKIGSAVPIGKKEGSDFSTTIYCQHLDQIFNILEWEEKSQPYLLMAPDHPLLVLQDKENIWALLPLSEVSVEE